MKKVLLIILACCIPFIGSSQEEQDHPNKWEWDVTPYLWAVGMKGDLSIGNETADVDMGLSDIMKNLKLAGMLHAEAKKGNWSIMTDVFYAKLSQEAINDGIIREHDTKVTIQQTFIELGGGYTFVEVNSFNLDVIFGARYFDLNIGVDENNNEIINLDENFIDPYVGLRFANSWNKFKLAGRIDVGGFNVGSEVSYKYNLIAGYQFSKLFALELGYQAYNPLYDNGKNLVYDLSSEGFLIGGNFSF